MSLNIPILAFSKLLANNGMSPILFLQARYCRGCSTNIFVAYLLIDLVSQWSFVEISSEHLPYQAVRAKELNFENWFASPICQVSHVTCNVSCVTCHIYFPSKVMKLVGGGSVINRATPSSFKDTCFNIILNELICFVGKGSL